MLAKHRVIISIAVTIFILITAAVAIFWARGFKPNFRDGKIERTGLIVATSIPTGAQVYLDDRLTSATDTNIAFLDPKTYKVRIAKDGYTTWQKDVGVRADLATEIKALLFPTAPQISPLTTTGATRPTLSPDNTKIAYAVVGDRGGLYVLTMTDRPLPFRQNAKLVAKNTATFDFTKATFLWGPDSKQLIARFGDDQRPALANLLIDTERENQDPRDITASLTATLASWQDELNLRAQTLAITAPDEVKAATAESRLASPLPASTTQLPLPERERDSTDYQLLNYFPTGLIFSPDEEKILYKDKQQRYHVYDLKIKRDYTLPQFGDLINISWYPDSAHLVVAQNPPSGALISIIEIDGANIMAVFSGKFENGFVFAHPSGTRLITLTTLTQTEGSSPNLYSINLR